MSGITLNDETRLILKLGIAFRIHVRWQKNKLELQTPLTLCVLKITLRQRSVLFVVS